MQYFTKRKFVITIYSLAYNEEALLQFKIDFYRKRFSDCKFVVFDNYSTDNTNKIAKENHCEVIMYNSNGEINDLMLRHLKNNCWKSSKTNWVLVCDVDEMLDISEQDLIDEEKLGTTIIRAEGWNMVNMEDNFDLDNIKHGMRGESYDKYYLFNKKYIQEINYNVGAHSAHPMGFVNLSNKIYKVYHYAYVNPDLMVKKYQWTAKRLSEVNKKYGMGNYCLVPEKEIRQNFKNARKIAQKIM